MRILHVVTAFPRTADDVIVPWLVELLQRLKTRGHDVEVFTSSYRRARDQVFAGIPVHRFRYFPRRWENLTHEDAALAALPPDAGRVRARGYGGDLAAVSPPTVRRDPRALAAPAGAVRVGGAARASGAAGHDLLRRGAALGEERDAVPEEVPRLGRAPGRPRRRDLLLHRPRGPRARRRARGGHPLHRELPRDRAAAAARGGEGGAGAVHRAVRRAAGGAQGRVASHRRPGPAGPERAGPARDRGRGTGAFPARGRRTTPRRD